MSNAQSDNIEHVQNNTPKVKSYLYEYSDKDIFIKPSHEFFTPKTKKHSFKIKSSKSKNKTDSSNISKLNKTDTSKSTMTNRLKTTPSEFNNIETSENKHKKVKNAKSQLKIAKKLKLFLKNDYECKIKEDMNTRYEKEFKIMKRIEYPDTDLDWEAENLKRKNMNSETIRAVKRNLIYELFEEKKWYSFDIRLFTFIYFRMRVKDKRRPLILCTILFI